MFELTRPIDLVHDLNGAFAQLRAFRRRADLQASPIWARLGDELNRVAAGLEFRPRAPALAPEGRRFVRVVAWNIERGKRFDLVMEGLRDDRLRSADVVILNEVDVGMARSGQRHIARCAADLLGMHYVFGNHYLCLDAGNHRDRSHLNDVGENAVGLHGNAILSRHPLRRAENVPLFETKDKFASRSEKRFGVKKALWAEIDTPLGPLVVAAVHLDSVASPAARARQLHDLLARLRDVATDRPLLVGGDWNTTTYDLSSPWALFKNIGAKFLRGGFRHAVRAYLHPYELYEKPVFDVVGQHGLSWRGLNDPDRGTILYDVENPDDVQVVQARVGRLGVNLLRRGLARWNGRVSLKVDWFAGRGCRPADAADGALAPRVIEDFRPGGARASDHDPIAVDLAFS